MLESARERRGRRQKAALLEEVERRRTDRLLENGAALERLRKNHYHLWKPLMQVRENPDVLEEWRKAPRGSQGWRSLLFFEQAIRVLEIAVKDEGDK